MCFVTVFVQAVFSEKGTHHTFLSNIIMASRSLEFTLGRSGLLMLYTNYFFGSAVIFLMQKKSRREFKYKACNNRQGPVIINVEGGTKEKRIESRKDY